MHLSPDMLNALFEGIGGLLMWLNVRQLWKDKQVRGVHLGPSFFFTGWGMWNLFYYPSLHQPLSFVGSAFMTCASLAWLVLSIKFRRA